MQICLTCEVKAKL